MVTNMQYEAALLCFHDKQVVKITRNKDRQPTGDVDIMQHVVQKTKPFCQQRFNKHGLNNFWNQVFEKAARESKFVLETTLIHIIFLIFTKQNVTREVQTFFNMHENGQEVVGNLVYTYLES